MVEKNEKSMEKKEDKYDNIKLIVLICTFIITAVVSWKIVEKNDDENKFILHTLSSEELAGETYTERTAIDDSDMWETEVPDNTETLMVMAGLSEPLTEAVVEFPLDINLANVDELILIDGVGTVTAENIVNYRNKYGYFSNYNQLMDIEGIGEKKLNNLMKYIFISDEWLEETTFKSAEQSKISEVTTVPLTEIKLTEAETVTIAKTEMTTKATEDIVIVNEEFVDDNYDDEFDFDESTDEYDFQTFTTTHYVNFPLNLNTATVEDLMCIDGIGESTAQKIVNYAYQYGFYSVDDLLNVNGIGDAKLAAIRPYVYVDSYMLPVETTVTTIPTIETEFSETEFITETTVIRVNVNTCGKYELMQIPGINEELADKIISFRDTIGGFLKIEEIALVEGMTNEKMSEIWDYVYIQ